jgi:hypothetical protein
MLTYLHCNRPMDDVVLVAVSVWGNKPGFIAVRIELLIVLHSDTSRESGGQFWLAMCGGRAKIDSLQIAFTPL